MIRTTGGVASGAISTKSRRSSLALAMAEAKGTMPTSWLSESRRRISLPLRESCPGLLIKRAMVVSPNCLNKVLMNLK